jgi:hypothetical protein
MQTYLLSQKVSKRRSRDREISVGKFSIVTMADSLNILG